MGVRRSRVGARHWIVKLNDGVEAFALDDVLGDLKKTPDAVEIPVPRCFVEDRAESIEAREAFLRETRREAFEAEKKKASLSSEIDASDDAATPQPPVSAEDAESALKASAKRAEIEALQAYRFMRAPGMPEEDALRLIQRNERGRQGRARSAAMAETRREQELADAALLNKRSEAEVAVICQALIRGFLTRRRVRRARDEELEFLGMKLPARLARATLAEEAIFDAENDISDRRAVALRDANNAARRRALRTTRLEEMERATVELKQAVKQTEGREMRERVQDVINAWFVENRDPLTEYPEFPGEDKGGSRDIIDPPPGKPPPPPRRTRTKAAREKKEAEVKKKAEAEAKKKPRRRRKRASSRRNPRNASSRPFRSCGRFGTPSSGITPSGATSPLLTSPRTSSSATTRGKSSTD